MDKSKAYDAEEILAGILRWVAIESPSYDSGAVNRMMDQAASEFEALGAEMHRTAGRDGYGDILRAHFPLGSKGPGILVLGHLDTVHPVGTIEKDLPMRREGDRQYGPGTYDMKGGVYLALYALQRLIDGGGHPKLPITFLLIPDEEVGSPSSREAVEREGKANKYVLVPEPGRPGDMVATGLHGIQRFFVRTHGRPAHAGVDSREGRNAIRVMAGLIEEIESMSNFERGVSYSVGVVRGGQWVNVVPSECHAQILAIAPDEGAVIEVPQRMEALAGERGGVRIEVQRGPVRPLFRANSATMALFAHAKRVAESLGVQLKHGQFGGGSDGNFTGALGIPTLDRLGVLGAGLHTHDEHLLISSLVPRARLLAGLFSTLK